MFDIEGPGGVLATQVEAARVPALSDESLGEFLAATDALASWVAARQAEAITEITRRATVEHNEGLADEVVKAIRPDPVRLVAEQVAVELGISKTAASYRVAFATALAKFPATAAALESGRLDRAKADAIVELLASLHSDEFTAVVERAAIDYAAQHTCPQLKVWLRKRVIAVEPDIAEQRREEAKRRRRVRFFAGDDGMATLHAELTAEDALAIYHTINDVAHTSRAEALLQDAPRTMDERTMDHRTMDERRADAFTDILLGRQSKLADGTSLASSEAWSRSSPVTEVQVVVDAEVLAGVSDKPGELLGYGAITAAHARELAQGDSRWRRLLIDPAGQVVEVSPRTYRPGHELSRLVRARDVVCRFPGCRRAATAAGSGRGSGGGGKRSSNAVDLDHTVPFPAGSTVKPNLAALCRSHHLLKTHSNWHVEQDARGILCWTTPSGRTIFTYPHDYRSGAPPSGAREGRS